MKVNKWHSLLTEVEKEMPWVNGITSHQQYEELRELMDVLVNNYEVNNTLINLISPALALYEESEFKLEKPNRRMGMKQTDTLSSKPPTTNQFGLDEFVTNNITLTSPITMIVGITAGYLLF